MKFSFLCVVAFGLSSCTMMDSERVIALGGRGAYNGRNFSGTWDNVDSFRDAAVLATAAAGAWASVASDKAAEATARAVNSNSTKQAINASNNATAIELGAQKTGLETTKVLAAPK